MALRLHVAAHHAEDQPGLATLEHHRGNDRVERPLPRLQAVRVLRVEREEATAVLQYKAQLRRSLAGAEAGIIALNERHAVAVPVHDAKIRRVAAAQLRVAGLDIGERLVHANELAAGVSV